MEQIKTNSPGPNKDVNAKPNQVNYLCACTINCTSTLVRLIVISVIHGVVSGQHCNFVWNTHSVFGHRVSGAVVFGADLKHFAQTVQL